MFQSLRRIRIRIKLILIINTGFMHGLPYSLLRNVLYLTTFQTECEIPIRIRPYQNY